jgi:2-oxoglutarate dehydrogenase E1 component
MMGFIDEASINRENLVYMEMIYEQYLEDPNQVEAKWRDYFQAMDEGRTVPALTVVNTLNAATPAPPPVLTPAVSAPIPKEVDPFVFQRLEESPVFRNVAQDDLKRLAGITRDVRANAGNYIGRVGQVSNDLYFIVDGTVAIERDGNEITQLGKGEVIGELAIFDDRPRSADILAKTAARLLHIARADLYNLLMNDAQLTIGMLRIFASRLRDAGFRQERVDQLVRAYRERGHVMAKIDPLGRHQGEHPELLPEHYGFRDKDLDIKFTAKIGKETSGRSLRDIIQTLQKIYCGPFGVQYMHIDDLTIQEWIRIRMEDYDYVVTREKQIRILSKLTDAEAFESFLHKKFVGAKRFSLEGGESLIPLLDEAIEEAGSQGVDEVVIGMAHRGRLNVLVNIMNKAAAQVIREFEDDDPEVNKGDVKYHLGYGCNRITSSGHKVHLSLCFNPSHLEFVAPVVMGRVNAKQERFGDDERTRALPIVIHGDAAFAGQGVVQELFNMSELPGYATGGVVHIVLNNQVGFTTGPEDGRSCQYATDVARMLQIPIFHVNGEEPEAVVEVIRVAMEFRRRFRKDVVIDMYCYRKYGHNEGDDPTFTQPLMYDKINKRKSVRQVFVDNLTKLGDVTKAEADEIAQRSKEWLENEWEKAHDEEVTIEGIRTGSGVWKGYKGGADASVPDVDTNITEEQVKSLLHKITTLPEDFKANRKIVRFLKKTRSMADGDTLVDWGTGEALAFASLLEEGHPVRITGQDSERGTFSHRHAVLHDMRNDHKYTPLKNLSDDQAKFQVFNSPLSEIAVLGFEYGYSLDTPEGLTIWEAQFGDFCNVAQVIIDQFITSSEEKWSRLSGLCLFLPHGFEGQGPEHSSARLERFLMLSADDNIQVVNLTTPAQLFHCLRRQVLRKIRKPLVVMSPKSLLRHERCLSTLDRFYEGSFQRVIGDRGKGVTPEKVERILICSGKIYYELDAHRTELGVENVAILRMEQYYPLPHELLAEELSVYKEGTPVFWVQEEPFNMGAWPFLKLKFGERILGNGEHPFARISRPESASPATGSAAAHRREQAELLNKCFDMAHEPEPGLTLVRN